MKKALDFSEHNWILKKYSHLLTISHEEGTKEMIRKLEENRKQVGRQRHSKSFWKVLKIFAFQSWLGFSFTVQVQVVMRVNSKKVKIQKQKNTAKLITRKKKWKIVWGKIWDFLSFCFEVWTFANRELLSSLTKDVFHNNVI